MAEIIDLVERFKDTAQRHVQSRHVTVRIVKCVVENILCETNVAQAEILRRSGMSARALQRIRSLNATEDDLGPAQLTAFAKAAGLRLSFVERPLVGYEKA